MAAGNGYVFEVTNTVYRIWTSNGTLVLNASLSTFFGTGSDALLGAQVRYDPATLRWFVSVEDWTHEQIYLAASLTSDPTAGASYWRAVHWGPGGGDFPAQPVMAVNSLNVVLTTNVYTSSNPSTFVGAQVYVINKTQAFAGGETPTSVFTNPNIHNMSLVPAQPVGASPLMYLVSDNGSSDLYLFTLSGTPTGPTVTLSGPVVFPSTTSFPPPASQPGTTNFVNTEGAQVQSAVWNSGTQTLWAGANVACFPSGDPVERSCLHLWELNTTPDTKLQDFNWSSGAGTYDFFPAVSMDTAGDLSVVFEESSSSLSIYPGLYATAQTKADPAGTLEPPLMLKAGRGADNPSGLCPLGICPFGNYSGAAVAPFVHGVLYLVGEYIGFDNATNYWRTWVESVMEAETYPVTFTESNLPSGTPWSVTVNGAVERSTSSTITFNESNGMYTYAVLSPVAGPVGTQFVATPSSGTFMVASNPLNESITYTEQFQLSTSVSPTGAGTVSPAGGWFNASATVGLSALAGAGYSFASWTGTGSGSFTGAADPGTITMDGPIAEQAHFFTAVTFLVTFTETGLPSGSAWLIVVNGVTNASKSSSITFNEPNGSYSFSTAGVIGGGAGTQYLASPTAGTFDISGAEFGQAITYVTQFELSVSITPANTGAANPTSGWFDAGSTIELNAVAEPGYGFASWEGSGAGCYSGANRTANVTLEGPVTEVAKFSPVTVSTASSSSGTVPYWGFLALLGAFIVALLVLLAVALWRRRPPPEPLRAAVVPAAVVEPPPAAAAGGEPWREDEPPA